MTSTRSGRGAGKVAGSRFRASGFGVLFRFRVSVRVSGSGSDFGSQIEGFFFFFFINLQPRVE